MREGLLMELCCATRLFAPAAEDLQHEEEYVEDLRVRAQDRAERQPQEQSETKEEGDRDLRVTPARGDI
jgi:hypothetical protein